MVAGGAILFVAVMMALAVAWVFFVAVGAVFAVISFVYALVRDTGKALSIAALSIAIVVTPVSAQSGRESRDSLERLVRVDQGDRAPFPGVLAPEQLFVDWRSRIVLLEERLRIDAEACSARASAVAEASAASLEAERARRGLEGELFRQRLEALALELRRAREDAKPGFFERPAFWFALGILIAGAGVALVSSVR